MVRLLLEHNIPAWARKAFTRSGLDAAWGHDSGETLAATARREGRLLVLRETTYHKNPGIWTQVPGVILLAHGALDRKSFARSVLSALEGTITDQYARHVTVLNGTGRSHIIHTVLEGGRIRESITIPRGTNEQFLNYGENGLAELTGIGISLAGFTTTIAGYSVERSPSTFHLIAVMQEGSLLVKEAGQKEILADAGGALFAPCGCHLAYRANPSAGFFWFHINADLYPSAIGTRVQFVRRAVPANLAIYAREFLVEARNPKPDRQIALSHLAGLIQLNLARTFHTFGLDWRMEESRQQLESAVRDMDTHMSRHWSVDDLAKAAGFSPSRLYRETWRHFRKRPGDLIQAARVRHASELLLHSHYNLQAIADMTGYSDAFSFSRAFKRSTGRSPSEFRSHSGR